MDLGCPSNVIEHSKAVSKKAVEMAVNYSRINATHLDMVQIECGALLHDIGRSKTHSIKHAVVGAEILRNLNYPDSIVNITLKHVGAGIPQSEAKKLGLEPRNYMPTTIEEKIVAHADNLIRGTTEVGIDSVITRWEKIFGKDHPAIDRLKKLHKELVQEDT
jgi:uncharacterized protein